MLFLDTTNQGESNTTVEAIEQHPKLTMALTQPGSSFAEVVEAVTGFQDAPSVSTSRKKTAEIYEKVLQVATKYEIDERAHEQLHDNHRGRDVAYPFKRHPDVSGIRANVYQSAVAVAPSIKLRDDLPPLPTRVFSSWKSAHGLQNSFMLVKFGMGDTNAIHSHEDLPSHARRPTQ